MNIGELSRLTHTSPATIRYYESIDLLPRPPRSSGNYRRFTEAHVRSVRFVKSARQLGFSIEQVRALLELASSNEQPCEAVYDLARARLAEVEQKMASLAALQRQLKSMIGRCQHGTIADCGILDVLQQPESLELPSQ